MTISNVMGEAGGTAPPASVRVRDGFARLFHGSRKNSDLTGGVASAAEITRP
ncbi:MAG: hypothetical protein HXX15_20505 [Rhodopseudomonas sp.]|uniref:hypothetical protein n=1 Tax=Rhodopseudomonas sp. TaxID=1078 RepID=UPI0017C55819|nr:hypothetical protein [Rhodopseudomonas sp.]NVN88467.1 hypothetical protein [Rhodopseudomonas sp.]